ncbi:hypothetical protein [Candidatus Microthrix parvicella]|uniref:hypothetical protein n=1 Tax=Candidatus Neomicrothrix parvicella TaxID=41950 RepID=UPI00036FC73C|nr:hypothetical protein [Candidatus Microthrix parvicella]
MPDYASAGTDNNVALNLRFDAAYDDGTHGNGCSIYDDYLFFNDSFNTGWGGGSGARAENAIITRSANLGNAGSVTFNTPDDVPMDGDANNTAVVLTFNVDPPFNNCRVSSANITDCASGDPAEAESTPLTTTTTPNTSSPFTQTVGVKNSGPTTPDWARLDISIVCD